VAVGPVIKDVLDRFLQTGQNFEHSTFYKLRDEVDEILDLPNNDAITKTLRQKQMAASPAGRNGGRASETGALDKAKANLDEVKQRMQSFKAEYQRQFVDINFYGMQSKIQNPMNSPNWTKVVRTQTADEQYNDQLRKIKD